MKSLEVFDRLLQHYGPQDWWPGESSLEIIVGAILTQNTAWKNVERAIENLRSANVLTVQAMRNLDHEELAELIRPAGYFNVKARRLRNFLEFLEEQYGSSLSDMFSTGLTQLRIELLGVNGIGPETADSILLDAGQLPSFVVDAYTGRVLKRHGWIHEDADYEAMKSLFERQLPRETALFNEFHALIVRLGKEHCQTRPQCDACPLADLLPLDGPRLK